MTLDRSTVLAGIPQEMERFAQLLGGLTAAELAAPTRCGDWTVAHVCGHVVGTVTDLAQGRLEGQGTPEVTGRQASERAGRSGAELVDELRARLPDVIRLLESLPPPAWDGPSMTDPSYTLGFAVEALWFDAYLHGDDIRAALGRPSERGDGLRCAVHHVAGYLEHRQFPPTTLALAGCPEVTVAGGGDRITGDPLDVVLAATGRADPVPLGLDPAINVYANDSARTNGNP